MRARWPPSPLGSSARCRRCHGASVPSDDRRPSASTRLDPFASEFGEDPIPHRVVADATDPGRAPSRRANATHVLLSAPPWVAWNDVASSSDPSSATSENMVSPTATTSGAAVTAEGWPPRQPRRRARRPRPAPRRCAEARSRRARRRAPADGSGGEIRRDVTDRDATRRHQGHVGERPAQGPQVPGPSDGRGEHLHRGHAHRVRADDLRRCQGPRHDIDPQLESPSDDVGRSRGHHERGSGVDASVDLIGLEHGADADRPSERRPLHGIQGPGVSSVTSTSSIPPRASASSTPSTSPES